MADDKIISNILNVTGSKNQDLKHLDTIINKIENNIGEKIGNNMKTTGTYNGKKPSSLYPQTLNNRNMNPNSPIAKFFSNLASNNEIQNKDIECDILVDNMPILMTSIELKRDNILPGDNISQDYMNFKNTSDYKNEGTFNSNIDYIKEKYKIVELLDSTFINVCKYGEEFYHIISYDEALKNVTPNINLNENINVNEEVINIKKGSKDINFNIKYNNEVTSEEYGFINFNENFNININNSILNEDTIKNTEKNIRKGAIIRVLNHQNVIPIYINETCLGYYYIEINENINNERNHRNPFSYNINPANEIDKLTRELAHEIAKGINNKFINTNNEYTNDIYNILKYNYDMESNNSINVTYISPDNMIHWYFRRNKKNNRGISDLEKSIVPAKSWILLTNSYKYGIIVRSHDKRIYYVKMNSSGASDTRIAIDKTIEELYKSNNGLNAFDSMASVAAFSGIYNDIVIPVNESNEAAIQFDTMQGQSINVQTEFLEEQEKQAIESMDMPYDYVKSSKESDFATRLNQQHSKFVKHCLKRQMILEPLITRLFNLLYKYEFNDDKVNIEVKLTPPVTMETNNNINIIQTQLEAANILSELFVDIDKNDPLYEEKLRIWRKNYINEIIGSYINKDAIDKINEITNIEYAEYKIGKTQQENDDNY